MPEDRAVPVSADPDPAAPVLADHGSGNRAEGAPYFPADGADRGGAADAADAAVL